MNWIHETLNELELLQKNINKRAKAYAIVNSEKNKLAYVDALCETSLYLDELACRCTHDVQYKIADLKNSIDATISSLM